MIAAMIRRTPWIVAIVALPCAQAQNDGVGFFEERVRPVLATHCLACHNDSVRSGELSLSSLEAALKGGSRGPAVVPGNPADSVIVRAVTRVGALKMPPGGPLPANAVDDLRAWIQSGAEWGKPGNRTAPEALWSLRPVQRPLPPPVGESVWARNSIDRFVLARLQAKGLEPSAPASRRTLIRRLSLDLTGLLPTPAEVRAFVDDRSPEAYSRLVNRLLDSDHYGERWGRHWLDIARYADTNGYSIDGPRSIWPYRDWVIRALNDNIPFDRFVVEQIAGDLLPNPSRDQIIATGFHRNTMVNQEGGIDFEQYRVEAVVDRVRTTGAAFLGLTLGCARCHDHKFDPISQREFYQFFAFFNNVDELGGNLGESEGRSRMMEPILELADPELLSKRDRVRERIEQLEQELATLGKDLQAAWDGSLEGADEGALRRANLIVQTDPSKRSTVQQAVLERLFSEHVPAYKSKADEVEQARKALPEVPWTMVMRDLPEPRESYVHVQGDFTRRGEPVDPGTLDVLPPMAPELPANRLGLARWLVSDTNPMTPRVTMNRIWQRYFGSGLVETENDFGSQGSQPTHPQLLDWLASEFVRSGWDLKHMHRQILNSATYRQSSNHRADAEELDPGNRLLARQNRLRLEAEIIRDASLSASGLLTPTVGGPSVYPPQPKGAGQFTQVDRNWTADTGPDRYRRGMYTYFIRSAAHPGLILFDAPIAQESVTRRNRSNTPLQALAMLNDESQTEFAQALARRVREHAAAREDRILHAFEVCLGRPPRTAERKRLESLLNNMADAFGSDPEALESSGAGSANGAAWMAAARVLLNLDEFVTRQ